MVFKYLLVLVCCVYASYGRLSELFLDKEWEEFKQIHNKVYSKQEENRRRLIWLKNIDKITEHNMEADNGHHSYRLGINEFGDMTSGEMAAMLNGARGHSVVNGSTFLPPNNMQLPDTVDWSKEGYVTPVKNQGQCGSCWAFSTTGGLEGQHYRKTGKLVSLSEQNLLDCSKANMPKVKKGQTEGTKGPKNKRKRTEKTRDVGTSSAQAESLSEEVPQMMAPVTLHGNAAPGAPGGLDAAPIPENMGCNGGLPQKAYKYIKENGGIDTEESYPYLAKKETCSFRPSEVGATCSGFVQVPAGDELALKKAVASVGPITVCIDASQPSFQLYKGGVYDEQSCNPIVFDHAVLIVGYGVYQGKDYWLVKNSWGTSWGMDGYIMMSRNQNNQCGIANHAVYPTV